MMYFDYEFLSGSDGILSAHLNGEAVSIAEQDHVDTGVHSEEVWIGEAFSPGGYLVAFRIDGAPTTSVRITDVRFGALAQPVPATNSRGSVVLGVAMVLMGGAALGWRTRTRV
jgi:hypothetical protein